MILTIHWVSIRYNSSRISVHFLFLLSVYYVPNGCVNDPLADKLPDKRPISWKSACQRASRATKLGNFFAFIRTKTPHLPMFELKLTNNMTCFSVTLFNIQFSFPCIILLMTWHYTGWPRNNGTVDTVDFSGLCSNQQLISSLCWIEHLFSIIITSRSSNLVENFSFYETFIIDCHFRDLPDFQSFEARWQINGKSQKWQSIRNYS